MIFDTVNIKLDYTKLSIPKTDYTPYMKVLVCGNEGDMIQRSEPRPRPTVLILPGGGYHFCSEREAEPVAMHYMAAGYNVCILYYSVAPAVFPAALLETLTAIRYIRENCKDWFGDPDRIFVNGFSAGGHLAASAGVFWNSDIAKDYFGGDTEACKPNGLILAYPVITGDPKYTHGGSIRNLLGTATPDAEAIKFQSLENQVTKSTPPTFIWSTFEDAAVPCESTLRFAAALRAADVPFEMHVFEKGPHGSATGDRFTCIQDYRARRWLDLVCEWIGDTRFVRKS